MHRKGIATLAVLAIVLSAGCVGLVFGDGIEESASPAAVEQSTLDETEFEYEDSETIEIDETVEAAGQERQVHATNHVAVYQQRSGLMGGERQTGAFMVVTTPDITVLGQSVNPAAQMSNRELVEEFEGQIESEVGQLEDLRHVDDRTETVLDSSTTVTTFAAETEIEGETVTVHLHIATVQHDGDVVIAVGGHPEALQQQASEIYDLMGGIEHPEEP